MMQGASQRREVIADSEVTPIRVGPICVDRAQLCVSIDGKSVRLTVLEGNILPYLAIRANTICSYSQIGSGIRDVIDDGLISLIIVTIHRLRQKIEPDPMHPIYLLNLPEVGYMLVSHDQDETEE